MSGIRYPYSTQQIGPEDYAAVQEVLSSAYLTQGPAVTRFEAAFAEYLGVKHCIAVNNATAALHLAYIQAGLGPDKALLTTPITFLSTASAARMLGAPVLFCDVDPLTGNATPDTLRRALNEADRPVGVISVVHMAGRALDIAGISEVARAYGAILVEDACHAPGASYRAGNGLEKVGSCLSSDFACFSFHAVKHIATGEGGAVCTNDDAAAQHMRLLRSHGMSRDPAVWPKDQETGPWFYSCDEIGFNYRLTDIQSALGLSQLKRLEAGLARRREIAAFYATALAGLPHVATPRLPDMPEGHAWHLYPLAIDFAALGRSRATVMQQLAAAGLGSQVHYIPLHHQPYYARLVGKVSLPGAEQYYARTLSVPLYPQLQQADLDYIVATLRAVLG